MRISTSSARYKVTGLWIFGQIGSHGLVLGVLEVSKGGTHRPTIFGVWESFGLLLSGVNQLVRVRLVVHLNLPIRGFIHCLPTKLLPRAPVRPECVIVFATLSWLVIVG